ncbi:sensor histidine kinase [Microbacteriaceae bacterium VKM Ac-2855]|nr:sensor histidine kinase [Microbacteriaceae bacterium VKM Ac-2855]
MSAARRIRRRTILRRTVLVVATMALVLAMEIAGFVASAPAERPPLAYAVAHTMVGLVFAACAGIAWRVSDSPQPARLMLAVAALWIPQTVYAVIGVDGRLWPPVHGVDLLWGVLAGILVLLYHSGRLVGALDRWIVRLAVVAAVIRFAASLVLDRVGPDDCACAPNPYALLPAPGVFAAVDIGFRLVGVALVMVVAVRVIVRWLRATGPARTVAFVMPVALFAWASTLVYDAVRFAVAAPRIEVLGYISLLAMAAIPMSFVAGLLFVRGLRGRVSDLMVLTRDGVDRPVWEARLARTLRDASLRVFWWDESAGRYRDAQGDPVDPDALARGAALLPIVSNDGPIALIRHDRALTDNSRLLTAVATALRLSVDNGRLRAELERTLADVRESRLRLVEAADDARKRIERDLHDGSQQQLVSLAIALRMARSAAEQSGDALVAQQLEGAARQLAQALTSLRELARGIHPSLLAEGGLELAIPELAARSPVPVELDLEVDRRHPDLVESTVYFVVAEALTNVAKYANARRCWVRIRCSQNELELRVRDNGGGGARMDAGSGLRGLADRVEAVGGTLQVRSGPAEGTTIEARLPL